MGAEVLHNDQTMDQVTTVTTINGGHGQTTVSMCRYGSGCYDYECKAGLLHIIVRDVTYSCHNTNQKVDVLWLVV